MSDHASTARYRAFREGVRRLERRVSLMDRLTAAQRERIARDDPFEVADPEHPAMRAGRAYKPENDTALR